MALGGAVAGGPGVRRGGGRAPALAAHQVRKPHPGEVHEQQRDGLLRLLAVLEPPAGERLARADQGVRERLRAAETPRELALAKAGACAGLGLLVLSIGENLLTQSYIYWYAAAAASVGLSGASREGVAALRPPTAGAPVPTSR